MYERLRNNRHRDSEIIGIAVDVGGAAAAAPYVERAGVTFPVVVDAENRLGEALGYRVVPNGVLLERDGSIHHARFGGFSVDDEATRTAVEAFLCGQPGVMLPNGSEVGRPTLESELAQTHFRLGTLLAGAGRKREAVVEWRRALAFDTDNYVIRKQIWAVEHPERFHPEVDYAWQKEQLRREQEEEASLKAQGCGPDGCPIPPR